MENNSKENVKAVFDRYFNQEINNLLNGNMNFYKIIVDNEKLRKRLKVHIFNLLYLEHNRKKRKRRYS
jgi:type I restriction enzyme R subunit